MKIINKYTGNIKLNDRFQCNSDGSVIQVDAIEKYKDIWSFKMKYSSSKMKQGMDFYVPCYDFEVDLHTKKVWSKM